MQLIENINRVIGLLFTVCYLYQFIYIPLVLLRGGKLKRKTDAVQAERDEAGVTGSFRENGTTGKHTYAVLICARNEEEVISDLLRSIRFQTYPAEKITAFVLADNCTDSTAAISRSCGAVVYERSDTEKIGKGYALEELFGHISGDYGGKFDGYFIFDADNVLAPDYIEKMDRTYSSGSQIITGYRNSKNYSSNWISAGYALCFLRESEYLNHARHILGTSCSVTGTGFFFSRRVAEDIGGWPFHLLTEDLEFSVDRITEGYTIDYCPEAEFYDEQPTGFISSWNQRLRWVRGYLEVFGRYMGKLARGILHMDFSCFDITMAIAPAFLLTSLTVIMNAAAAVTMALTGGNFIPPLMCLIKSFSGMYALLFVLGAITTATEWDHIHAPGYKKVLYTFTFPLFMFTYIPVSFAALFRKPGWKPVKHTCTVNSLSQVEFEGISRRSA